MRSERTPLRQLVSRRRLVSRAVVTGTGFAGALILACGGDSTANAPAKPSGQQGSSGAAPTATAPENRQPGGEMTLAQAGNPPNLDPHLTTAGNTTNLGRMIYSQLAEYVLAPDPTDLKIVPSVAEKWETADGQTFAFTLRDGVRWQNLSPLNGRAMTAEDIKYSFDRLRTSTPVKALYDPIDAITVPDPKTVAFKLKAPYGPFLNIIAEPQTSWLVAREIVEKDGDLTKTIIGGGPFMFDAYSPGSSYSVKKNPDYFQKGYPLLDKVTRVIQADESALLAAFISGQLAVLGVNPIQLQQVEKRPNVSIVRTSQETTISLMLRLTQAPFSDVRVRKAIAKAINQQRLIDVALQRSGRLSGPIPPGLGAWSIPEADLKQVYAQDVAGAQQLMKDAGMGSGFSSSIMIFSGVGQTYADMAQLIQQDLAKINIQVTIDVQDQAAGRDRAIKGDFAMLLPPRTTALDPDLHVRENFQTSASRNWGGLSDPELDRLIGRQQVELNEGERKKIIEQIQRRVFDLMPEVFLPVADRVTAIRGDVRDYWPHTSLDRPAERAAWLAR